MGNIILIVHCYAHQTIVGTICRAVNCGYMFEIIIDIADGVESASAFSLLTNIENEINTSTPLIVTEPYQYSSSESDMC